MIGERRKTVVIVGGGITGLAAARRLRHHSPDIVVFLIESDDRLGGKISTVREDGFVIEGGPDSFLSYKPRGLGLCRELGLENRLYGTNRKVSRTYIMRGGRLYQLPEGLTGLIPSRFEPMLKTPLISPWGKARMGLEFLVPPRKEVDDESLEAFVSRRLGHEAYDRMIEPLMSGVYAGDGSQLSLDATFPNLRKAELEHGSLIKSMLATRAHPVRQSATQNVKKWPAFLTLETGLTEIVEHVVSDLHDVQITLKTRVKAVTANDGIDMPRYRVTGENGEEFMADAIILATPAFITEQLVNQIDPEAAKALTEIPYVSTATVSVAYPLSQVPGSLDSYGYIVPRSEGRAVLACTWTSTKFPHRAPQQYALLRAFLGRAGNEAVLELSDDELIALVRDELRAVLGITAVPHLQTIFRWPKAMPQYTLGHLQRLKTIEHQFRKHEGLFYAGAAYQGIGIPDCIASGEAAAEKTYAYCETLKASEALHL